MPSYERSGFDPPASVVNARLLGPNGTRADVPLLLDSGADVSVVPLSAVRAVGASIRPNRTPIRFLGEKEIFVDEADLAVEFLRYRFRGTFLVIESSYGVLGRNVMNALLITLDGPRLQWSMTTGAQRAGAGRG